MSDRIDEWLMSHLTEFAGKKFQSVAKGGLELGDLDDKESTPEQEQLTEKLKPVLDRIKELLKDKVKEVRTTRRLTSSPACIVADEHDMTPQMERLMRAAGQNVPHNKPILELNPEHMMIKKLEAEQDEARFADWTWILFDQAVLAEAGQLEDPAAFVQRLNKLLLELS